MSEKISTVDNVAELKAKVQEQYPTKVARKRMKSIVTNDPD